MIHNMQYQNQCCFNDCGPACLVMIASYHYITVDLTVIKRLCKMKLWGTNLETLVSASQKLGFKTQAFKGIIEEKSIYELPLPCIAHITHSWFGIKIKHYVIVADRSKHYVEIWDPNPKVGIHKLTHPQFLRIWTGYIVVITSSS